MPFPTLQLFLDGLADEVRPALSLFEIGVDPIQRTFREARGGLLVIDLFSAHGLRIDDITNYYKPVFVDISY